MSAGDNISVRFAPIVAWPHEPTTLEQRRDAPFTLDVARFVQVGADTAPHAICLAALAALEATP